MLIIYFRRRLALQVPHGSAQRRPVLGIVVLDLVLPEPVLLAAPPHHVAEGDPLPPDLPLGSAIVTTTPVVRPPPQLAEVGRRRRQGPVAVREGLGVLGVGASRTMFLPSAADPQPNPRCRLQPDIATGPPVYPLLSCTRRQQLLWPGLSRGVV